jgi:hypothetical protein
LLDQMVAPIALYPDALLSQILMASTYPLEVIEAYRWVSDSANTALSGPALDAALEAQDWDPSVKSLVPFPDVLKVMNDKLGWMQQLGNAFLSQPQDVMDAVQRLRSQAAAAGNLKANEQQRVVTEQRTIIIQPANPQIVYVPVYDPMVVYGPWAWPGYPPMFFEPFPRYGIRVGMFSWFSFGIISLYWGWNSFDWHHHYIHIDRDRYDRIWRHREHYPRDHWEHDPYHRRGVAYVDPRLRARFRPNPPGAPATRIDYRGYPPTIARTGTPAAPPLPKSPVTRPAETVQPESPAVPKEPSRGGATTGPRAQPDGVTNHGRRTPPSVNEPPARPREPDGRTTSPPTTPTRDTTPPRVNETRPGGRTRDDGRTTSPPTAPTRDTTPPRVNETRPGGHMREGMPETTDTGRERRVPPAFEGYSSGDAVRAATVRARTSRESEPAPEVRTPAARPDRPDRDQPRAQPRRQR